MEEVLAKFDEDGAPLALADEGTENGGTEKSDLQEESVNVPKVLERGVEDEPRVSPKFQVHLHIPPDAMRQSLMLRHTGWIC